MKDPVTHANHRFRSRVDENDWQTDSGVRSL